MGKREYIKIFINGNYMCDCGGQTCKRIIKWGADEKFDPLAIPMGLLPRVFDPHYTMDMADELKGRGYYNSLDPKMKYKLTYHRYTKIARNDLRSVAFMHIRRQPNGKRDIHHIWIYQYDDIGILYQRTALLAILPHPINERKIEVYEGILQQYGVKKINTDSEQSSQLM